MDPVHQLGRDGTVVVQSEVSVGCPTYYYQRIIIMIGEVQNPAGNCGRKRIWDVIPWLCRHGLRGASRKIHSLNPLAEEKDPTFNAQLVARKYKGIDVVGKGS